MQSTFSGIEIGKRSLNAHNQSLSTVGHNLSNASTEGYSRQRVDHTTFEAIYAPELNRAETPGQIGQGVSIGKITRARDMLLEGRIDTQSGNEGYWATRDKYLLQLEQMYNEPTESSVRSFMDKFWDSWQELSLRPSDISAREAVLSRGQSLAEVIRNRYRQLTEFRSQLDGDIRGTVIQINEYTKQIASTNKEIQKAKAVGDNPNDLMDTRDLLVEKLSFLLPITVDQRDSDEFMVHSEGLVLVQGGISRDFVMGTSNQEGLSSPIWQETGLPVDIQGGSLGAFLGLRDTDALSELKNLNTTALTFSDLVNESHRAGYGLNGKTGLDFFSQWPFINNVEGNYDASGDGVFDSTYLYRVTGANNLQAQEHIGLAGTITLSSAEGNTQIKYSPVDSVADLVARINYAKTDITARLTRDGKLELRATPSSQNGNPDFVLRHIEDSGQFLVGYAGILQASGPAGAYDFGVPNAAVAFVPGGANYAVSPLAHPAGWLEVNPDIKKDPSSIVGGFGVNGAPAEAGDGSAALAIASLRTQNVMVGSLKTFDDHFAETVARIGLAGEEAQNFSKTHDLIGKQLRDLRSSISGVNMDEEMANMIKFQHGYSAAARFITKIDSMLDTIINRMGV